MSEKETCWSQGFVSRAPVYLFLLLGCECVTHVGFFLSCVRAFFSFVGNSRQRRRSRKKEARDIKEPKETEEKKEEEEEDDAEERRRKRNAEGIVVGRRPRLIATQACGTRIEGTAPVWESREKKRTKNGEILKILINTPHIRQE